MTGVTKARRNWPEAVLCVVLLSSHVALLAWGAYRHSPSVDEWGHLPAGLTYWLDGRCDVYRVNPPLVRAVAAIPLLFVGVETSPRIPEAEGMFRSEVVAALDLYCRYGTDSFRYFTAARLACIPFSLMGAFVCYRWSRELYGRAAGIVAMTLWCYSPDVLAHGQMITPDTGAAAMGLAANYFFWRWLREPERSSSLVTGMLLGLALLTKSTWILLFLVWPVLWLASRRNWRGRLNQFAREGSKLAIVFVVALFLLNAGYNFDGSMKPLGEYGFVSRALGGDKSTPRGSEQGSGRQDGTRNRFAGTPLGSLRVPFPQDFVLGIDLQKRDFEEGWWSYLRGEWRKGGWWYYYLYAMAIKTPLGTWAMFLLASVLSLRRPGAGTFKDELCLLAPAAAVLVLVSSQTGFNHHVRYVLPAFPYLFIFASKVFKEGTTRPMTLLGSGLLAWSVAASMSVYPHSLAYFNELVGGPTGGHAHIVNSNVDWGQNMVYLREWLDDHPEVVPQGIALAENMPPQLAGCNAPLPPSEPMPGWFIVAATRLQDKGSCFSRYDPVAMVAYTTYIYHVSIEEANRVRRELNMQELSTP